MFNFFSNLIRYSKIGKTASKLAEDCISDCFDKFIFIIDAYGDNVEPTAPYHLLCSYEAFCIHAIEYQSKNFLDSEKETRIFESQLTRKFSIENKRLSAAIDPKSLSLGSDRIWNENIEIILNKLEMTEKICDDFEDRDARRYAFNMAAIAILAFMSNNSVIPDEMLSTYDEWDEGTLEKYDFIRKTTWDIYESVQGKVSKSFHEASISKIV